MNDTTQTITVEDLMNYYSGDTAPDHDAPPADEWGDIPADYRDEVYCELPPADTLPDGSTDGIGNLDRQAAERLVKRYHRLAVEEREAVAFVDEEIAVAEAALEALEARRAEILKPIERKRQWLDTLRPLLELWTRETLAYGKARSVKLAYGTVKIVSGRWSTKVLDEKAALEWAETNAPTAVKRSVLTTPVTEYIEETGEVPPGVDRVKGDDTFSVEVEG